MIIVKSPATVCPRNRVFWPSTVVLSCALAMVACRSSSDSSGTDEEVDKEEDRSGASAPESATPVTPDTGETESDKAGATIPAAVDKADPPKDGTYITFNVGLLPAVGLEKERLPQIVEALKETRASVACLQEVWTPEDVKTITSALAGHYPNHFWKEVKKPDKYEGPVCELGKAMATQRCATEKCTPTGISLTECVSEANLCKAEYDAFSDDCKRCLAANTTSPTSCATSAAPRFSMGGHNGLLLLSWHEIENPTYTELETELAGRGVITATIQGKTVQCTHLTADLDVVPYPAGTYKSWAEEHKGQLSIIDKAADDASCRVLLGDMNTGPTQGDMVGEIEDNFPAFEASGYAQPWDAPSCTFCADNPLSGVKQGRWIDHIFFKGCAKSAKFTYKRVFDQPIQVMQDGKSVDTRLSDHYGVLVETSGL